MYINYIHLCTHYYIHKLYTIMYTLLYTQWVIYIKRCTHYYIHKNDIKMYILICTQRPEFYVYTTIYTIKIWIKEVVKIALRMRPDDVGGVCGMARLVLCRLGCWMEWCAHKKKCVHLAFLKISEWRCTWWQQPRDSRDIEWMRPEDVGGVWVLACGLVLCRLGCGMEWCVHKKMCIPRNFDDIEIEVDTKTLAAASG